MVIYEHVANGTLELVTSIKGTFGEVLSPAGTGFISIYEFNSDTEVIAQGTLEEKDSLTGIHRFKWEYGTYGAGYYGMHYQSFDDWGTSYTTEVVNLSSSKVQTWNTATGTIDLFCVTAGTSGLSLDPDGDVLINVYPNNSDTQYVTNGTMTKKDGKVGLYKYALNVGTYSDDTYTIVYEYTNAGTTYREADRLPLYNDGGTVTDAVGTIAWDNGTTGSTGTLMWSKTGADGYNIYIGTRPFTSFALKDSTTEGTIGIGTLEDQQEYWFYVVGTNGAGAALPSPMVSANVHKDQFNYTKNVLEQLKTSLENNISDIRNVVIGEYDINPSQFPLVQLIAEEVVDDDFTTTGKFDILYNIVIRVYTNWNSRVQQTNITENMELVGLIKTHLESVKRFMPYWYTSNVVTVDYDNVDPDRLLKWADIAWTATRRITRTD